MNKFGQGINLQTEDLSQSLKQVDASTDIQIFIESNKSLNDFVHKETLIVYDESTHMTTRHNSQASTASDTNPYGQGGKPDSQMTPE